MLTGLPSSLPTTASPRTLIATDTLCFRPHNRAAGSPSLPPLRRFRRRCRPRRRQRFRRHPLSSPTPSPTMPNARSLLISVKIRRSMPPIAHAALLLWTIATVAAILLHSSTATIVFPSPLSTTASLYRTTFRAPPPAAESPFTTAGSPSSSLHSGYQPSPVASPFSLPPLFGTREKRLSRTNVKAILPKLLPMVFRADPVLCTDLTANAKPLPTFMFGL